MHLESLAEIQRPALSVCHWYVTFDVLTQNIEEVDCEGCRWKWFEVWSQEKRDKYLELSKKLKEE